MYVLLYLEFYAPTFTSAEILRAAELSPSRSVCRIEGSAQPPDPSKVQTITRSDLGRSCFRDSNTMPLHTTYHKPNPIAIYRSPEALLHQRISSTSDQTIIMTTYLEGRDWLDKRTTSIFPCEWELAVDARWEPSCHQPLHTQLLPDSFLINSMLNQMRLEMHQLLRFR